MSLGMDWQEIDTVVENLQSGNPYRLWWPPEWARKRDQETPLFRFRVWLAETVHWSDLNHSVATPADALRSEILKPEIFLAHRFATVADIHRKRSSSTLSKQIELRSKLYELTEQGRLLVYFPGQNLADGAAHDETNGYFDNNNRPPWDTWVDYFEDPPGETLDIWGRGKLNYLVSWVHPHFLESAQAGIDVNPEKCICWLEESGTLFNDIWPEVRPYIF